MQNICGEGELVRSVADYDASASDDSLGTTGISWLCAMMAATSYPLAALELPAPSRYDPVDTILRGRRVGPFRCTNGRKACSICRP